MSTIDQAPHLAAIFTLHQQRLIGDIVDMKITELITSGSLVCSHCSSSSSNSQLPWSPADSRITVPTTPLQAFDKQLTIMERQLSEQETKLQQFMDNHSSSKAYTSCTSTNSVAANLSSSANPLGKLDSVEQRVTDLEYLFKQFQSSNLQSSNLNSKRENVDSIRLLDEMHAKFEINTSKLQSTLQQTVSIQQKLASTDYEQSELRCSSDNGRNMALERSDVNKLTVLRSMAVDKHEVLSTLVSNVGHKHNELAEFVRQVSQCTASADQVIELKAVVECMARVTGVSEHKAEQLIIQFVGREGVELEHLKREQRLADDKIRELQLAKDQMIKMCDSPNQNQLPYLNVVTETLQRECERYKRDLNAISKRLSERVNVKVAQAIQQSLVDKHKQNNRAHFGFSSTEYQDAQLRQSVATQISGKIPTEMLQPVADDDSTVIEAAATSAVAVENELKRLQNTHIKVKGTAICGPPSSSKIPAKTSPTYTRLQPEYQPMYLTSKSISELGPPYKTIEEPLNAPERTAKAQKILQDNNLSQSITCVVVGHESAQTHGLIQAYANRISKCSVRYARNNVSVNVHVADDRNGIVHKLHLTNCTEAKKLNQIRFCDVIVICYSVIDKVSYRDVQNVWLKQINEVYLDRPYLLVGTQVDKRQISGIKNNFVAEYSKGVKLSQKIGAFAYYEDDVLSVDTMFMDALQHAVDSKKPYLYLDVNSSIYS